MSKKEELKKISQEIAALRSVIEHQSATAQESAKLSDGFAFVWQGSQASFTAVERVQGLPLDLLLGIDRVKQALCNNTKKFAERLPANNALLWGVRGMGKSSLVKAVFLDLRDKYPDLKIIEIHREDIDTLPLLLDRLRAETKSQFILFCDDLSFDEGETSYKSLKAVLEGGLEGRPRNVIFYATSNRRHILARDMKEQNESTVLMPSDAASEKISLSDRFGLWLGFHNCSQDEYVEMIRNYIDHFSLKVDFNISKDEALEWAKTRGARSGRVAWQYIQHLAGELKQKID